MTLDEFERRIEHVKDQLTKNQWMNVLAVLIELQREALSRLNDELKERERRS